MNGLWRRVAVAFAVLMVLAIGFSRIALGVHYVSDVLGGYVLGSAWVAAMAAVFNAMRVDRGRRRVDVREGLEPEQGPRLAGHTAGDEAIDRSPEDLVELLARIAVVARAAETWAETWRLWRGGGVRG